MHNYVAKYLARIPELCNCGRPTPNIYQTNSFIVSRSRTVNPVHVDLVLSGVSIRASPDLNILGIKFDSKLTFEDPRGIASGVPQGIGIEVGEACLCGHLFVTSLLLCICSPNTRVLFSSVGVCCWVSQSVSWAPGVFGDQALPRSEFLVFVSSTPYSWTVYVVQG